MVTDLLLVKLVHKHLNNDIEFINGLESVHPPKCMDKSKHLLLLLTPRIPLIRFAELVHVLRGMGEHIQGSDETCHVLLGTAAAQGWWL